MAAAPWRQCHNRVQVQLGDQGYFFDQPGDSQEQIFDGAYIRGRMASVAFQQPISFDSAHHFRGIAVGDGSDAKADVLEYLDVNSAQTETDQRAEERILRDPDH